MTTTPEGERPGPRRPGLVRVLLFAAAAAVLFAQGYVVIGALALAVAVLVAVVDRRMRSSGDR